MFARARELRGATLPARRSLSWILKLRWQCLRNVVLDLGSWMVEIDQLVRAGRYRCGRDEYLFALLSGAENEAVWMRRLRD
jgi:hypothetical protein